MWGGKTSIALGGFMGVGKTTVGRKLALSLHLPFCDMDEELMRRHGPIALQFKRDGEATFRQRERDLIIELCHQPPLVVATGGGVWVDPENRANLKDMFRTVVLTAPLVVLRHRLTAGAGRPLWTGDLHQRYESRQAAYGDAELTIDTGTKAVDDVVEEIQHWIYSIG
ncbi:MAG: shikimate kinase [Proteobacteria bacterium]|nr:shikimate kinase [Pseudomonadota bacterium]